MVLVSGAALFFFAHARKAEAVAPPSILKAPNPVPSSAATQPSPANTLAINTGSGGKPISSNGSHAPYTSASNAPAAKSTTQSAPVAQNPKPKSGKAKPPILDPGARAALAYVGVDTQAEEYWIEAINDPTLPSEERKDLIEDLNEDGLANPHLPTADDMPIITRRLELIEELAPYALDRVNAAAFAEAYKDLVNLWNGLPAR